MNKSVLIINTTIFLLFLLSLPTISHSQRCNKNDEKVLFQIKKSLGNPYLLASWQKTLDCCEWYNVECDANTSRIIALTIFSGNISGQIPKEVGDLPYLQTLVFRKLTNLTGEIPSAITKLTHLTMLRLSWTNLSGPVPSFLSQLKNLDFLDLSFNDLTGSIPPELATLTKLNALHLDRNKLTGVIPDSFGRFTGNVPDLYLSHNQLTGTVPISLGYLNFTTIDFSRNQLTGDLSMFFGTNKTIQIADFSRNSFEFNLSQVEFPASLTSLDLNHNKIYGSLPATLTGLDLQYFNVSYNRLCGKVPQGGELQKFDNTSYFHNRCLCGSPLPACT
ncbi:polygalacturonase inhibitor-like [Cynara cardunculus var. scolymus]|uniref:Leucine-rich repeat-containing protein n=1 Tax=Cynara cardunculus var. scolymus TaxID=59895 RepID=A0A124SCS7_CYNCS|nr:polygalacturonase inhibitor-like [Cynara cardunculus var. scolymus]KVH94717.1 Leucine-rich repeat-containing protein [Cynara cardunculus var. scolymus]